MECYSLRLPSPDPRANMRQIFDRNRALRALSLRNNPFGDSVVDVFREPRFLSRKAAQTATAIQRAALLQLLPEPPMAVAHVVDRLSAVNIPIAIDGNIGDSQIDTQDAFHEEVVD